MGKLLGKLSVFLWFASIPGMGITCGEILRGNESALKEVLAELGFKQAEQRKVAFAQLLTEATKKFAISGVPEMEKDTSFAKAIFLDDWKAEGEALEATKLHRHQLLQRIADLHQSPRASSENLYTVFDQAEGFRNYLRLLINQANQPYIPTSAKVAGTLLAWPIGIAWAGAELFRSFWSDHLDIEKWGQELNSVFTERSVLSPDQMLSLSIGDGDRLFSLIFFISERKIARIPVRTPVLLVFDGKAPAPEPTPESTPAPENTPAT